MPITVWGLAIAQALLGTGNILLVTVTALVGKQLASHPALITVPIALQFVGTILSTLPAAHIMQRFGRKIGFVLGNSVGILGAYVALQGLLQGSLSVYALGTFLIGMAVGVGQQYRFAAIDAASIEQRPRAISMVMAGGVLAAILGPNLAVWFQNWSPVNPYAGAFYGLFILYIIALALILALPLTKAPKVQKSVAVRSYRELFQQPLLLGAVVSGMIGYGIMVLLMTGTPLIMEDNQQAFPDIAKVVQWHVLGMFAPSFFTGRLIRRFTGRSVILWGCVLLLLSAVINILDTSFWYFFTSMLLLGVGWNFTFIGATHLLTFTYEKEEQGKVQGMNEFLVFTAAAIGSLFAGQGIAWFGWTALNVMAIAWVLLAGIIIYRLEDPVGKLE